MATPLSFIEPHATADLGRVVRSGILALTAKAENQSWSIADWPETWRLLQHHRVGGLLAESAENLPPEAKAAVLKYAHEATFFQLALADAGQTAVAALNQAGIESRILKGLATSLLDYPSGSVRHTGDVDLLVRQADFAEASRLLRGLSVSALKEHQPVELLVETTFRTAAGIELDLHHRLFRVSHAHEKLLFDRPAELPDGLGHALSLEGRLLHAAGHLMLAPPGHRRLSSLIDVALMSENEELDEAALEELTEEFGLSDLVQFARWLGDAVGNDSAPPMPVFRKTAINRAHLRVDRSIFWETVSVLQDLDSITDRARYLRYQSARALPSRFTASSE